MSKKERTEKKMKKAVLCLLAVLILWPGAPAPAGAETHATLIWEGVVTNANYYNQPHKVRFTITGVVGVQVAEGKVDAYDEVFIALNRVGDLYPQYILPVVDGGSIKVEYLGDAPGVDFNDSEEHMGLTEVGVLDNWVIHDESDPRTPQYINLDHYIPESAFFVNPDFMQAVKPTKKTDESELRCDHLQGNAYYASVNIPVVDPNHIPGRVFLRIVSKEEAARMMEAIRQGHPVRRWGKRLDEPVTQPDKWEHRVRHVDKTRLEREYGVKIEVRSELIDEPTALEMVDQRQRVVPGHLPVSHHAGRFCASGGPRDQAGHRHEHVRIHEIERALRRVLQLCVHQYQHPR